MAATAITVISPRRTSYKEVAGSHLALEGIDCRLWLVNGGDKALWLECLSLAEKSQQLIALAWIPEFILPIPWAWNKAIALAQERFGMTADLLRIEDDVKSPPDLLSSLQRSGFDLPAAYHHDRPLEQRELLGVRSIVDMATLYRPRVLDQLGFYDEFILGACDTEFGMRASNEGFSVGLIDQPRVVHLGAWPVCGNTRLEWWMYKMGELQIRAQQQAGTLQGRRENPLSAGIQVHRIEERGG